MFSQILVGTRKNSVIELADFGTQTEKGCPPSYKSFIIGNALLYTFLGS